MEIKKDFNLQKFNTFNVPARAKLFTEISSEDEIGTLFQSREFKENQKLFLGGGSNLLFTKDFDGLVILNKLEGIEIASEDDNSALVKAMSGTVWQDLVDFAIEHDLWGIENMSYIPGSVGAGPMQNIGAYGQDINNTLESLEAYDVNTGEKKTLTKDECRLGYRNSCFKREFKDKYFISSVTLRLSKTPAPNLGYKGLSEYLKDKSIEHPSLREISDAVGQIRHQKLPDPKTVPNAGSFFKNVLVEKSKLDQLLADYPDIRYYPDGERFKIPSAWLIEQCGYKGKKVGNTGTYKNHALVLVNHGEATGEEIREFSQAIISSVKQKFDLTLEPEVNFV